MATGTRRTARTPSKKAAAKKGAKKSQRGAGAQAQAARVESLTAVFRALGARDPRRWARSHVETGADELARFVLLRALWLKALEPGRLLARARKDKQVGGAIDRLIKRADLSDLDALIRITQELALKDVLGVLDDPADNDEGIGWGVFRRDSRGLPMWRLEQLTRDLDASKP